MGGYWALCSKLSQAFVTKGWDVVSLSFFLIFSFLLLSFFLFFFFFLLPLFLLLFFYLPADIVPSVNFTERYFWNIYFFLFLFCGLVIIRWRCAAATTWTNLILFFWWFTITKIQHWNMDKGCQKIIQQGNFHNSWKLLKVVEK